MKTTLPTSLLAATILMTLAGTAHAQTITPIDVTGYTSDVIFGPTSGDTTANGTFGGFNFYSTGTGFNGGGPNAGLPDSGTLINGSTEFQFQPYTGNNALVLGGSGVGTLTLNTSAAYSDVSFLVNAQGGATATFTLNFASGPSQVVTAAVPNWIGGDPVPAGGSIAFVGDDIYAIFGQPAQFDEFDFAIDPTRTLTSVDIATSGNTLGIYAISGTVAVPEPSSYAMIITGLGLLAFGLRLSRNRAALKL